MRITGTATTYLGMARALSRFWRRPFGVVLGKLVASRVMYDRGPQEFNHFQFTNKRLRDWSEYITEREINALQDPLAPAGFRYLDDDKVAFASHCRRHGLPTPALLGVIVPPGSRRAESDDVPRARNEQEFADLMAALGDMDGFAKPLDAGQGYGAFGFRVRDGVVTTREGCSTMPELFARCATSPFAPNGYLLQQQVVPHPALTPLMPGPGLGTVRVLSFLQANGDVVLASGFFKMPAPGAECDNLRTGALVSEVDVETGTLRCGMGDTADSPVVRAMDVHPVTGARITGVVLPEWNEVRELLVRAARAFHELPVLGWDVAITNDGPLLIEANVNFAAPERASGRGHAADMRRLFSQVAQGRMPGSP